MKCTSGEQRKDCHSIEEEMERNKGGGTRLLRELEEVAPQPSTTRATLRHAPVALSTAQAKNPSSFYFYQFCPPSPWFLCIAQLFHYRETESGAEPERRDGEVML